MPIEPRTILRCPHCGSHMFEDIIEGPLAQAVGIITFLICLFTLVGIALIWVIPLTGGGGVVRMTAFIIGLVVSLALAVILSWWAGSGMTRWCGRRVWRCESCESIIDRA